MKKTLVIVLGLTISLFALQIPFSVLIGGSNQQFYCPVSRRIFWFNHRCNNHRGGKSIQYVRA